jgi:NADH-quinone oxidoreductase subunit F
VTKYIQPTSVCGLGAVASRLIKQAMEKFPEDFAKKEQMSFVNI